MRKDLATYGRNLAIMRRLEAGERGSDLAREYRLSRSRIKQIEQAVTYRERWRGHYALVRAQYPLELALLNMRRVVAGLKVLLEP